jgi:hypothetical protein
VGEIDRPVYDPYGNRRIAAATRHEAREIDECERIIIAIVGYTFGAISGYLRKDQRPTA